MFVKALNTQCQCEDYATKAEYLETTDHLTYKNPQGFPGGSVVKNPPANAGDTGSIPDLGRSHMPQST